MEYDTTFIQFRLAPYFFRQEKVLEMYELISHVAGELHHETMTTYIGSKVGDEYKRAKFGNSADDIEATSAHIIENLQDITIVQIEYRPLAADNTSLNNSLLTPCKLDHYTITIDKYWPDLIDIVVRGVQLDGLRVALAHQGGYAPWIKRDYNKSMDEYMRDSAYMYQLTKQWMHFLQAEECWGVSEFSSFTEPLLDGYHYTDCAFRFTRKGPQYIDLSMEEAIYIEEHIAKQRLASEMPEYQAASDGYDRIYRPHARIIDASWEEYWSMSYEQIKPNLRYVTEKQLYDEKDGIFADAPARRNKCLERRKDFKSGKLNYDDGFMTL
jgi:hypothetical protein